MKETIQELQEGQTGRGPIPGQEVHKTKAKPQKKGMGYIEEEKEDFTCTVEY